MDILTPAITILSYIVTIIAIIMALLIFISVCFSDIIVKKMATKIKEKRREVIKIQLQDFSLYIQLFVSVGISFMLFSLSQKGVYVIGGFLIGLSFILMGFLFLFWKYMPLRNKMYQYYNSKKKSTK